MYKLNEVLKNHKNRFKVESKPKIQLQELDKTTVKNSDCENENDGVFTTYKKENDRQETTKVAAVSEPVLLQQPQKKQFDNVFDEYLHDLNLASGNAYGVTSTNSWIKQQLRYRTIDKQRECLQQYRAIYLEHYNNEPLEHKRANAGEYRANVWLRETTDKVR